MLQGISEPDWKEFRQLHQVALERFCQRILAEVQTLAADQTKSGHERYLAIFQTITERHQQIKEVFSGMRRSTAQLQLIHFQSLSLMTEDEILRFSVELREWLSTVARIAQEYAEEE